MKYKIDDKVMYVGKDNYPKNVIGVVTDIDRESDLFRVDWFEGSISVYVHEKELTPFVLSTDEKIVAAAVYYNGTFSLLPPARHGTIMRSLSTFSDVIIGPDAQGFLTSKGRYVNREEAYDIAWRHGQLGEENVGSNPGTLYSEDLW